MPRADTDTDTAAGAGRAANRAATGGLTWARPVTIALAVLACAFVALASASALAATAPAPKESIAVFEGQLHGHQVRAVTLRPKAHRLTVLLGDGHKVVVVFPASRQQQLRSAAEAGGVTVKVAKVKPPSHKRRDIAIAVVLVIALAVGAWLLMRRRRTREEEYGPAGR